MVHEKHIDRSSGDGHDQMGRTSVEVEGDYSCSCFLFDSHILCTVLRTFFLTAVFIGIVCVAGLDVARLIRCLDLSCCGCIGWLQILGMKKIILHHGLWHNVRSAPFLP